MAKARETLENYDLGIDLAEKCFDHSLTTGTCNPSSSEFQIYCENIAFIIRGKEAVTRTSFDAVTEVKKNHNNPFYNGVCDFLIEKMKEYQEQSHLP